ncbi:MAG: gliding motility-associated ABC transporter substrate-binding protein GldG [Bacteroidales bacterium]|nr:gliding motility-associated ABC transporter substrate-binding protein GldG [Bacteroidales bacterium]MCF8333411.1 gliding motility-associated ABC transporter substrate-binding protein GldG [Bacteroidales bacterium]
MALQFSNKQKKNNILQLVLAIAIIILVNIIGKFVFARLDLTEQNRYSLSDDTKEMLNEVDDIVFFKVYLEGDFPAGFKRLKRQTREMLNEFRAYNKNIEYEFINPSEVGDKEQQQKFYQQLSRKGLSPTTLRMSDEQGSSQKIIFPGAIVSYRNKEIPVQFLVSQRGQNPEKALNKSVQNLEYNMANVIQKLIAGKKKKVGFLTGHGELGKKKTQDITQSLKEYYSVERVNPEGKVNALTKRKPVDSGKPIVENKYDVIIVAKPDSAFSEKDKFILDQYIMHGGKVMWFVDQVSASMDSLRQSARTMGLAKDLNLQDMFFNYGFRINTNLVQDLNCASLPIMSESFGGEPKQNFFPWYYFPVIVPKENHPIVANLNNVRTEFVSTLDQVKSNDVKKTTLLRSSQYTKLLNTPVMISLELMQKKPNKAEFSAPPQSIAMLLEGKFSSLFHNRVPQEIMDSEIIDFRKKSRATSMVVFSDGDIIENQLHYSRGYPLPLGYDQFTQKTYGNKDLVLNTINYLTGQEGILAARAKDFKIRLMDKSRIKESRVELQLLNTVVPVLLVIIFGMIRIYLRKRKYTRN